MNERIEKLMVNASSGACYDGNEPLLSGTEIEKFAELIVKECLRIVAENTYGPYGEYDYSYTNEKAAADDRANEIYADIKDRFGVE
jgi:hypothetical protein